MTDLAAREAVRTDQDLLKAVRELAPRFRERALETEQTRALPQASVTELRESGIAGALVPRRWGGMELDLHTWLDLVDVIAAADASHGWCANLLVHQPQVIAYFSEEAQAAVWGETPNVAVAGSFVPACQVRAVDGGFRISGQSPFASGVDHCSWVWVAGIHHDDEGRHIPMLFLVASGDYEILDTWDTAGMRGTGSNTIVTDDVHVPAARALPFDQLVNGTGPGSRLHDNPMYRLPFASYSQTGFAATMLGAARGAYEHFRAWTESRSTAGGSSMAGLASVRVRMARAAADLDAADLLLRRVIDVAQLPEVPSLQLRARAMRDCARASELVLGAIDALMGMSGTAGFGSAHPLQRAWRDIHFASCHVSLNPEISLGYWGGMQLGAERPAHQPVY